MVATERESNGLSQGGLGSDQFWTDLASILTTTIPETSRWMCANHRGDAVGAAWIDSGVPRLAWKAKDTWTVRMVLAAMECTRLELRTCGDSYRLIVGDDDRPLKARWIKSDGTWRMFDFDTFEAESWEAIADPCEASPRRPTEEERSNTASPVGAVSFRERPASTDSVALASTSPDAAREEKYQLRISEQQIDYIELPEGDSFQLNIRDVTSVEKAKRFAFNLQKLKEDLRLQITAEQAYSIFFHLEQHSDVKKLLDYLAKRAREHSFNLYLSGGFLRDVIVGTPPNDVDLAGDVPPSLFRHWVREHGLNNDVDYRVTTSKNNVTQVKSSNDDRSLVEYGLFKSHRDPDNKHWVATNSPVIDYRTRDTAQNSLLFTLTDKFPIEDASHQFVICPDESAAKEFKDNRGHLDVKKFMSAVIPVIGEKDEPLHKSFDQWGYYNFFTRLAKTALRLRNKEAMPDAARTGEMIGDRLQSLRYHLFSTGQKFKLPMTMLIAACLLEAIGDLKGEEERKRRFGNIGEWLVEVVKAANQGDASKDLAEKIGEAVNGAKDFAGNSPPAIKGDGLIPANWDDSRKALVYEPQKLDMEDIQFTPRQLHKRLRALVTGWTLEAVPVVIGSVTVDARAWKPYGPNGTVYLVEVSSLNGEAVRAVDEPV